MRELKRIFVATIMGSCLIISSNAAAQTGACCDTGGGGCTVTLEGDCPTETSVWISGETCSPSGCPANFEVEPNNVKETATPVTLAPGDTFSGMQNQFFTDFFDTELTGSTSRDLWKVTTAAMPPGIYRHSITPTVNTRGMVLMAKSDTIGAPGTEFFLQFADPDPFAQGADAEIFWYGFGKQESAYAMILGLASNLDLPDGLYTYQLETTPVAPEIITNEITSGPITITVNGADTQGFLDADFWVYDSNFNAIPGAGNDDSEPDPAGDGRSGGPSILTRTLPAGEYYLGISIYDLVNDQTSPEDESTPQQIFMDFPHAVSSWNAWYPDSYYGLTISDSDSETPDVLFSHAITGYNEVAFVKFTVSGGVNCAADFNGVNGVTVQDIFDFLTAWLAGSPSANFNSVNGVTVQDIFDFLTAWLAGC